MSSLLLKSSSQISTCILCQNCGIIIDHVSWKQCTICKKFNLCVRCENCPYNLLEPATLHNHIEFHKNIGLNDPITDENMQSVLVTADSEDVETRAQEFCRIMKEKRIENDYDMCVVTGILKQMKNRSLGAAEREQQHQLGSMIVAYHTQSYQRNIYILSLDGGGVRGYMPIKVLCQLITDKYLANIEQFNPNNSDHREQFKQVQSEFTNRFDYFVGTSTGGLIAFCLAINYSLLEVKKLYTQASYYFNRNYLGPLIRAKYDPSRIHNKIDEIIGSITLKNGKRLSAKDATLLDIHNFLNPDDIVNDDILASISPSHGNLLEFVDDSTPITDTNNSDDGITVHHVKREKVLLITAYNTTTNTSTVFNTSYAPHWPYRIADVLKATMAAPTFFPPHKIYKGTMDNGHFVLDKSSAPEVCIDGGVFANDPELTALWAVRMQWKKLTNYHLLSIGTGYYTPEVPLPGCGGFLGWILNNGLLVYTLMDATRSITEIVTNNLAKFNDIKRMKFNYKITKPMNIDDTKFVQEFDKEWEILKSGEDFKALVYFYNNYIHNEKN